MSPSNPERISEIHRGRAKTTQKESRPGNQTHNLLADFCHTAVLRHVVDMAQIQLKILGSRGGSGCLSRVESRVKVQAEGPGWSPGPNSSWSPGWRWPLSDVPSWCPGGGHVTVAVEHLSLPAPAGLGLELRLRLCSLINRTSIQEARWPSSPVFRCLL